MKVLIKLFVVTIVLTLSSNALAESFVNWQECDGNGIFMPGGERSGADYYFNVEGVNNCSYASWAGARWTGLNFDCDPGYTCDIEEITITLGQSNASFTTNGLIKLYLAPDGIASEVQDGGSLPYAYAEGGTLLTTYNFVEQSNGYLDVFQFQKGDAGFDELAASVQDGTLVLAFVEGDGNVAATWGGISNNSNGIGGARLDVTGSTVAVPEPSTILLLVVGSLCGCAFIRRNHK